MKVSPGELVFDCWQARTADFAALKAAGMVGGIRYIDGWWPGSTFGKVSAVDKSCGPSEVASFAAHGMGLLLVWQTSAGFALNGAPQGDRDGRQAREQAEALDYPLDRFVVFFAVDTDVSASQHAAIEAYARAFGRHVPHVGCYGEADLLDHLGGVGVIERGWLPGAASWSNYRTSPKADVTQLVGSPVVGGILIDRNWVNNEMDFWLPGEAAQAEESEDVGMLWQDPDNTLWHVVGNTRARVVTSRTTWPELEADIAALVSKGLIKLHELPDGRAAYLRMSKEELGFFAPVGEVLLGGAGASGGPLKITLTGVATP